MSFETLRTRHALTLFAMALVAGTVACAPVLAQTAAPAAQPAPEKPAEPKKKVEKSVRLDKHAGPWTVIWHTRLWTDVPETEDFVKATHPDPKTLEYAPLIGTEPNRPKPRDAKGIAALQAELEGDIKRNEARGKAINDVGAPASAAKATRKAKGDSKLARAKKTAKTASKAAAPD